MEKITISRITSKKTNKEGKAYITKTGKPFEMMGVLIKGGKYDGKWASACLFEPDHPAYDWKEGDTVEVVLEQNGEYLNFKVPSRLDQLEARVAKLEASMAVNIASEVFSTPSKPIEHRISADDIPF